MDAGARSSSGKARTIPAQTAAVKPSPSVHQESRETGETLTLPCAYKEDTVTQVYWFKHSLGEKLKLMTSRQKYAPGDSFQGEFKNNPRFSLETQNSRNNLIISDLQSSDSATYSCVSCRYCMIQILATILVSVKNSYLNIPALIHQSRSETIQHVGSVTLNCTVKAETCDGGHSVYWFKNSEESQPGLLYTNGGRNEQCVREPDSQTRTCEYSLPLKNLNLSDAGTYYCAVISCGHILFGNGTKLDLAKKVYFPYLLVYFLSGGWTITTILLVFLVCRMNKRSHQCKECKETRAPITFSKVYKAHRSRVQRNNTWSECVYLSVTE
ncbi:uncharacterized protein LOC117807034 [Xyrichtys novacula]|uniref:Uncharacterized protein LOC117807034 n=1 Tax=Xyrichtys novacula TaxID=13765 RepID=A0AAV1HPE8_XYRNO|nr:uncharacterized protein LOC117807034 [Xyrichtys novacula]